jgi:type I restriction enzyme S subunit
MIEEHTIPHNWVINRLGDFVYYQKGKKPKSVSNTLTNSHTIPYVNIKAFEKGIIDEFTDGAGCILCEQDDFLMVWDGARSGYIGRALKGALGSTLVKIQFPGINLDYAYFYLQSKYLDINTRAKGTGIPHVDPNLVWNYYFPLPPLAEQQRIVEKIEELFSELEKGIETLKTAEQQLKVYRQAVLKSAFEGKLTMCKRERGIYPDTTNLVKNIKNLGKVNRIKLKYDSLVKDADLPQIPSTWNWLRNEELLKYVTSGSRDWKKFYDDKGSIFIRTQDIKTNLLDLKNSAFVNLPENVEGKRSLVEPGDILMTITGANVGKVAVIPESISEAYVSQSVALMKLLYNRMSKYLWYYFQSRTYGEGLIGGLVYGVGRPVLSLENMREVPVAICSIEEQDDIIQEIESRLSVCDKIEESIEQGLQQAEALRQSILKKAFEGKLVPQDPNDEPASVLLERIKAERATSQPEKKSKSKKVK